MTDPLFERWELYCDLGQGPHGQAWLAHEPALARQVVLKIFHSNYTGLDFTSRLYAAACEVAVANSPHLAAVYETGQTHAGQAYAVSEYLPGGSLAARLARGGPLPLAEAGQILLQACAGLEELHRRGLAHGNLKPSNLLFTTLGKVVLTDSGLGEGPATPAGDVLALGELLAGMLAGPAPAAGPEAGSSAPPPGPLPPALQAVLERARAADPAQRFASAAAFSAALQKALPPSKPAPPPAVPKMEQAPEPTSLWQRLQAGGWLKWILGPVLIGLVLFLMINFPGGSPLRLPPTAPAPTGQTTPTQPQTPSPPAPTLQTTPTQPQTLTPPAPPPCTVAGESWTSPIDGMPLRCVASGTFTMGRIPAANDTYAPYRVYLDSFWMDASEVSNAMYRKCVQAGQCLETGYAYSYTREDYAADLRYNDYPVIYVTWDDAQAYCAWAGGRLPTEAQWEKAARGLDGRFYPWGNDNPDVHVVNFNYYPGDTTAAGTYPLGASPYGVLDMAGNVQEWVADWYSEDFYPPSLTSSNPTGPASGTQRALRGGSWTTSPGELYAGLRFGAPPTYRRGDTGFRCVR